MRKTRLYLISITMNEKLIYDRMVLEGRITNLLQEFIQKHPDAKPYGVDIRLVDCKNVECGNISTCITTDVKL